MTVVLITLVLLLGYLAGKAGDFARKSANRDMFSQTALDAHPGLIAIAPFILCLMPAIFGAAYFGLLVGVASFIFAIIIAKIT